MIYPQMNCRLRTHNDYVNHAKEAHETGSKIMGIKGPTYLSHIFELPDSLPCDYMHLICLGLFRHILHKWFDSKNSTYT